MSIVPRIEALIARAGGPADSEEARTSAWIACKMIREHRLTLRETGEGARRGPDAPARRERPPAPRVRQTEGPYVYCRDVSAQTCLECGEAIAEGDALRVESGPRRGYVHGDCVPAGERPLGRRVVRPGSASAAPRSRPRLRSPRGRSTPRGGR